MALLSLAQRIASVPRDRLAAIDETGYITYGELLDRAEQLGLEIGTEKQLVILSCETSINWLTAYTAVMLGGHAAFLVAADATEYQASLASNFQATVAMSAASQYRPERLRNTPPALNQNLSILLSTSGSTGSPKCVRLSNENLASNAQSIATYLELEETERGVVSLPVHYSYGMSIVNSHLWVGATLLMTERSLIEPEFWTFCNKNAATSFAGVPHSYDLLSRIDFLADAPPTLRYFTQAGGRLGQDHIAGFAKIAQAHGWRFYVMYGQTEASPRMAWLPPKDIQKHVGSIGIAIPGGKLTIRDQDDQILGPETEGELVYEGQNVMMGYAYSADDLPLDQGPQELHTGDLACQSQDGFFYITGRMSRFVKIFGNRIGLDEVEAICASAGYPAIATGTDQRLLVVTREAGAELQIKKLLSAHLKLPEVTIEVRQSDEYPVLASGKIDYAQLKATIQSDNQQLGESQKSVKDVYRQIFGSSADDGSLSFYDLGGDSLTFVRVSLDLESVFGAIPENWHQMPADELEITLKTMDFTGSEILTSRKDLLANLDTVRTVACILVVALHVLGEGPSSGLKVPSDSNLRLPFEILDLLRMPLFTALAGLLFASMTTMHNGLIAFIKRRFITLMIPAFVLSIFYYVLRTSMGKTGPPLDLFRFGYLHFWYLYALFQISVAIALIDTALRPSINGWLFVALCTFVISQIAPFSPLSGALILAPYYVLGIVIAQNPSLLRSKEVIKIASAVSAIGLIAQIINFYHPYTFIPIFESLVSFALIIVAIRFTPRIQCIEWIGIYSYAIYLWHPAVNSALRSALIRVIGPELSVLFVVGLISGTFLPILIYRAVNRWPAFLRIPVIGS